MPVLRVSGAIAALKNRAVRAPKGVLKAATSPWVHPKKATPTASPTGPDAPMDATKQKKHVAVVSLFDGTSFAFVPDTNCIAGDAETAATSTEPPEDFYRP